MAMHPDHENIGLISSKIYLQVVYQLYHIINEPGKPAHLAFFVPPKVITVTRTVNPLIYHCVTRKLNDSIMKLLI